MHQRLFQFSFSFSSKRKNTMSWSKICLEVGDVVKQVERLFSFCVDLRGLHFYFSSEKKKWKKYLVRPTLSHNRLLENLFFGKTNDYVNFIKWIFFESPKTKWYIILKNFLPLKIDNSFSFCLIRKIKLIFF